MELSILYVHTYIVNFRTVVEKSTFDEYDEIQHMDEQQQESASLSSDITPSNYLRHQQNAGIIYANPNEETKL